MATPSINGYVSTSNYFTPRTGANENLCLAGINFKKNKLSISLGAGVDTQSKSTMNGIETSFKPSFEAKTVYNMNEYFNTQARFREIGNTQQYRIAFGGKYPLNDKFNLYAIAHATTKKTKDNPLKTNFGAMVGTTYKLNNSLSLSAEIQQNITPHQNATLSNPDNLLFNFMVSWNF